MACVGAKQKKKVILTKNAIHGGVESLILMESEGLPADVLVCGGMNNVEGTCPFSYIYVSDYLELRRRLRAYDAVVYHWLPQWAVTAVKDSGLPSVEFVHRTDTCDCDKTVPTRIVSHSQFVCNYVKETYHRNCCLVPNVTNTDFYTPATGPKGKVLGAVTSYYDTKGIDLLIRAWKRVSAKHPDYRFVIYGSGDRARYEEMARQLESPVELCGPVSNSKEAYDTFALVVSASRIEGLPIALLEALSCNLEVLASDIEGHRIINELVVQEGLDAPLHLFKAENVDDLVEKLDEMIVYVESGRPCHNREAALKVFSAHRHIEALRGEIEKAMEEKRTDKPCGMLKDVHDVKSTAWRIDEQGQKIPVSFPAKFTYMSFLMITIPLSQEENRVMCTAKVELNEKTGVWRQFNGYDSWKHSINCQGEGILMDPASRFVHSVYVANQHEASLDFIIRPDQGRTITVMGIQIQTGKA